MQIPGQILPPGTYWFVLADQGDYAQIVQIFSPDWKHLYATLETVACQRYQPAGWTELQFAERPEQKPPALRKWYYPGLEIGHEFIYTKKGEAEFARDYHLDLLTPLMTTAANSRTGLPA